VKVGTREEWLAARVALLAEEKELTRRSDELARKRQALPWVAVEKEYRFETEDGTKTLDELFDGRPQLLVYHFMFGPTVDGWPAASCVGCSYTADSLDGAAVHLPPRGVVYHTYSCYDRGTDVLNATWQLLDRAPNGRGGDPEGWPRRHDEYE
jgi:predicted dithiol-disulfide oxidoreductase (DUF899 family)